jgi:signal transduction histidine kinase
MSTFSIILLVLVFGMGIALYFQMKAGRKQSADQAQLLQDYQRRVDEQQKLLDDYRALEKNFDSVGEGYEQALLAFDEMGEETQKLKQSNESLEQRCATLQTQCDEMQEFANKSGEIISQTLTEMERIAIAGNDVKLMALIGKIGDIEHIKGDASIARTDNILVSQVSDEAIRISGVDKVSYLKFAVEIAPDAAATMLSTNLSKAVRALTHLLDNALKFTTDGSVTLRVAVDMMKMVAIYTVEDTGAGVEPAEAEHIFEPYVKLNQFFDGNGIGLTVARNMARSLGGDVALDQSFEGPGSRFVLTLPI